MIKHLVLSGGGPYGFVMYGCLKNLNKLNYWKLKNIKSIHATSVGSIIGTLILLNIDWKTLDDYFLLRPWKNVFNDEFENFFINTINNNGIDCDKFIKIIFEPLLSSKNISLDITLKEFYEITNIDFYVYTTNINTHYKMKNIELSHKSYPNMKLINALSSSSCYPLLFKPIIYDNMTLLDGGIINSFPLIECINNNNLNTDALKKTILGIKLTKITSNDILNYIDYVNVLIRKTHDTIDKSYNKNYDVKNIIECEICENELNLNNSIWIETLNQTSNIKNILINIGIDYSNKFLLLKK